MEAKLNVNYLRLIPGQCLEDRVNCSRWWQELVCTSTGRGNLLEEESHSRGQTIFRAGITLGAGEE